MEWWQRVMLPVKRALIAFAARLKARKDGGGILILHNDVQSCGYRDVQVMWEILQRSESELSRSPKRKRPFGRVSVWSGGASSKRAAAALNHAPRELKQAVFQ